MTASTVCRIELCTGNISHFFDLRRFQMAKPRRPRLPGAPVFSSFIIMMTISSLILRETGMLAVAIDSKKIPKGEVMIGREVIHLDDLRCVDQVTMC